MVILTEADCETLNPIVVQQADKVAARYDGVDPADLGQEVWVALLEGELPLASKYIADNDIGKLTRAVYHIAVKWCEKDRKEKLKAAGVDWRDEYNYRRPEVARLLPAALDPLSAPGLSTGELHDAPSGKSDPATGGNMLAALVDVRTAYSKLSESDQQFVQVVIGLDSNWDHVAAVSGRQAPAAYAKYMRILDRMVTRHLGRRTDDDDEDEPNDE